MTSRRASLLSRLLREEEGGFLVEILVSAVILVVVGLSTIAVFDTTAAQSGQQRAQAVASNLAASEIERLRSLRFDDLSAQNGVRPVRNIAGIAYTITNDIGQTGTPAPAGGGCETATRSAEALRATTTVTWPSQGNQRPVRLTSLLAAPANASSTRGMVVVQVTNYDGFGVGGLSISLAGVSNVTATTDDNGCARFTDMAAGTGYRLTFSRAGWADPLDREAIDDAIDVVAGAVQTKSYQYDPMGRSTVNFFYKDNRSSVRVASPQLGASWTHSTLTSPKTQTIAPAAASVLSRPLRIVASAYGVYADTCAASLPPTGRYGSVVVPGNTIDVQVPMLRVRVRRDRTDMQGARVFATTACGTRYELPLTGSDGRASAGVPYALNNLTVCAQFLYNGVTVAHTVTGQDNDNYGTYGLTGDGARNDVNVTTPATPVAGSCP